MKNTIFTFAFLVSVAASANSGQELSRVRAAMKSRVGISNLAGDVRLNVYKSEESICGSAGNSVIAEFQVKRFEKAQNSRNEIVLKEKYETVKVYGISVSEVQQLSDEQLAREIMDSETCME